MSTEKETKRIPIKTLDQIVARYGFDLRVVEPISSLYGELNYGMKMSDHLISHDCMFFAKGVASHDFNQDHRILKHWSLADANNWYLNNKIYEKFPMKDILTRKATKQYLSDRANNEDLISILEYRWDTGMAFTDYQRRIEILLERKDSELLTRADELTADVEESLATKALLEMGIENLSVTGGISDMLKNLTDGIIRHTNEDDS